MLRRKCARNNHAVFSKTSSGRTALNKDLFFFILAIILFIRSFNNSAFPADEKIVDKITSSAISASGKEKAGNGAAVSSSPKDTTQIVVNVIVNTEPKGDFFIELDDKQNLFIRVEDARILKLQYAENRIMTLHGDEQYVPLSALPMLHPLSTKRN